jgi:hypothetical protein
MEVSMRPDTAPRLTTTARVLPLLLAVLLGGPVATRAAAPLPLNTQVSADRFVAHAEPDLAVNPRDPRNLLGAAQFFASRTALPLAGTFASYDGGRTWHDNGLLPVPRGIGDELDTTVAFNQAGTGYVAAMAAPGIVADDRPASIYLWRTNDGGRSFTQPVRVGQGVGADHPWLAVDPQRGGPNAGTFYLVWRDRSGLRFTRSTDNGRSFAPARTIVPAAAPAVIGDPVVAAGPAGAVSAAYYDSGAGHGYHLAVVSSTDGGRTFGAARVLAEPRGTVPLYGKGMPSSRVAAAIDPRDGWLYVTAAVYRPGHTGAQDLLYRSRDDGRTWAPPTRADTSSADAAMDQQPRVAVGSGGTVAVSYLALLGGRCILYLAQSVSHGARFSLSQRVSSASFNPEAGLTTIRRGSWWIGDYQGLAVDGPFLRPFWNDTRTGRLEIFTAAVPLA